MSPNSNASGAASPRTVPPTSSSSSSTSSSTSSPARPDSRRQPAPRPPSDAAPGRPLSQRKRQAQDRTQDASEPGKERKADVRPRRVDTQALPADAEREAPPPARQALTAAQLREVLQAPPGPALEPPQAERAARDLALALTDSAALLTRGEMRDLGAALVRRFGGDAIAPATCANLLDAAFSRAGERTPSQLASLLEGIAIALDTAAAQRPGAQYLLQALARALPRLTPRHLGEIAGLLLARVMAHGQAAPQCALVASHLAAARDLLVRLSAGVGQAAWAPRPRDGSMVISNPEGPSQVAAWLGALAQHAPGQLTACLDALAAVVRAAAIAAGPAWLSRESHGEERVIRLMREEGLAFMVEGVGLISPPPEPAVLRSLFSQVLEAFGDTAPPAGCALAADEPLIRGLVRLNAATIAHGTAGLIAHRRITPAIALADFQALAAALLDATQDAVVRKLPLGAGRARFAQQETAVRGAMRGLFEAIGEPATLHRHRVALANALGQVLRRPGPCQSVQEEAGAIGAAAFALAEALGGPQAEPTTVRFLLDFALSPPAPGPDPATDAKETTARQRERAERRKQQALQFQRHALRGVLLALGGASMGEAMRQQVAGYFLAADRPRLTSRQLVFVGEGWVAGLGGWNMPLQRCVDWAAALIEAAGQDTSCHDGIALWCWALFHARLSGTEPARTLTALDSRLHRLAGPPHARQMARLGLRLATDPVRALEANTNNLADVARLTNWVTEALAPPTTSHGDIKPWMGQRDVDQQATWRMHWRQSGSFVVQQFAALHEVWNVWPQAAMDVVATLAQTEAWNQRLRHGGDEGLFPIARAYLFEALATARESKSTQVMTPRFTPALQLQDAFLRDGVHEGWEDDRLPDVLTHSTPAYWQDKLEGDLRRLQRTAGVPGPLLDMLVMRNVHLQGTLAALPADRWADRIQAPTPRFGLLVTDPPQPTAGHLKAAIARPLLRTQMLALCAQAGSPIQPAMLVARTQAWCEALTPRPAIEHLVEALVHSDTPHLAPLAAGVFSGLGVRDDRQALGAVTRALVTQVRQQAPLRVITFGHALARVAGSHQIQPTHWTELAEQLLAHPHIETTTLVLLGIGLYRGTLPSAPDATRETYTDEERWPIESRVPWRSLFGRKPSTRSGVHIELLQLVPRFTRFQQDPMAVLGEQQLLPAQRLALGRALHQAEPPSSLEQAQALVGSILHSDLAPADQSAWVLDVIEQAQPRLPVLGLLRLARTHLVEHLLALDAARRPLDDKALAQWVEDSLHRARQPAGASADMPPPTPARPSKLQGQGAPSAASSPPTPAHQVALWQLYRACDMAARELRRRVPALRGATGADRPAVVDDLFRLYHIARREARALTLANDQIPEVAPPAREMARLEQVLEEAWRGMQASAASSVTTRGPVGPRGLDEDDEGDAPMPPAREGKGS